MMALYRISKDGSKTGNNVTPKDCPKWMMWIVVSRSFKGAAYIVGTRYKLDDFKSYIYKNRRLWQTWKQITSGIDPMHFAVARADRKDWGFLYAGTEYMYNFMMMGATNRGRLNMP